MKELVAKKGDVALFSESVGDQNAPAVLLIMGAMASGVWWPEAFCAQLASRGRFVIRYDHRDTGRSTSYSPGKPGYSVEDLADDALTVLDAYGINQAHHVGMSLGGYLAQLSALKAPERVLTLTLIASERLALTDPALPGMDPKVLAYHAQAGEMDWTDRRAVLEYQVGAWRLLAGSAHPFDEEGIRALAAADFERTPNPLVPFNHARLGDATGWVGRLDEITAPALIIHGTEDPVLPYAHGLALHAGLRGSRLLTLPGTGHELHPLDWPTIVDAIVAHTGREPGGRK
jgi:pimeloyl-ACP methyl ester carboxylesterase